MAEQFSEKVEILDSASNVTITLDGNAAGVIAGGNGQDGDLHVRDSAGNERIWMGGNVGNISVKNVAGEDNFHVDGVEGDIIIYRKIDGILREVMKFDASHAALSIGCTGNEGDIFVRNNAGDNTFIVDGNEGDILVRRRIDGNLRSVMRFDASHAALHIGCEGNEGDIFVRNNDGDITFSVDGNEGDIIVRRRIGGTLRQVLRFDASHAALYLGCQGNEGDIIVRNNAGETTFAVDGNEGDIVVSRNIAGTLRQVMKLDASHAALYLGCEGNEGDIIVRDGAGRSVFHFDSAAAALYIGATGNEGDLKIRDGAGRTVFNFDSNYAALYIGANGNEGDIFIRNNAGDNTFTVDGNEGDIRVLRKISGVQREVMKFDASHAALYVGCEGNEGDIIIRDGAGRQVFHFDSNYAALYIGANGNEGDVIVRDGAGNERIRLDGHTGDIRLQGADCAEEFDVAKSEDIDPGTVLVIDEQSKLRPCRESYDKKVTGVVSGGNGSNPGIILDKNSTENKRLPIALNGKVYCKVDAQYSSIEVGDLLTTSSTPGHAMKADDPLKAFGAVIGKALRSLKEGKELIPILVALQ